MHRSIAKISAIRVLLIGLLLASFALACGSGDQPDSGSETAESVQSALEPAPDFTLPSANTGETVSLSQFRDDKPVVLVFYRAYW